AYIYYRSAGEAQLAASGLLSFAAIAQLAPAFFGGLIWPRGTARGAIAGMTAGILVWGYTLLVPSISDAGIVSASILTDGPWGLGFLRPQALFDLDRAGAGGRVRALDLGADPGADGAELSAAAGFRHGRRIDRHRGALSRRGAHPRVFRQLRRLAPHQPRAAGRGRF